MISTTANSRFCGRSARFISRSLSARVTSPCTTALAGILINGHPAAPGRRVLGPCELEEAKRRLADPNHPWFGKGSLDRADSRNALNALIQGTAARHTKLWMRAVGREGIVPLLQMHDALECSVSTPEQAEMVAQLCVDAIKLKVPMRVDLKSAATGATQS